MKNYILSIDQGTTGTTVSLIDSQGGIVAQSDQDFAQIYPQSGWVEHDLGVIWSTVEKCARDVLQKAGVTGGSVMAIGITNQRETVGAWNRLTGKPYANAIVWQCRRTTDFCNALKKNKKAVRSIRDKTGLVIDPYFSGSKFRWYLKNLSSLQADIKKNQVAFGTIDTFLLWKLTAGQVHATDVSNASRTQLMNIHTCEWDRDLLKIFAIPFEVLPEIRDSSEFLEKLEV